jgi:protein-tyrosine phosphatase
MLRLIGSIIEFFRILKRRYTTQGFRTTAAWLWTVGLAKITGRLSLRYSRVTPQLYIGPQYGKRGKSALEEAGINASVSMRAEFDSREHELELKDHSYLPTEDNMPISLEHLDEGVAFIERIISEEGRVYVHCGSGVGRAPSMVAAYLIKQGDTLEEAVEKIQRVRPFVRILPGQIARLREYENQVRQAGVTGLTA